MTELELERGPAYQLAADLVEVARTTGAVRIHVRAEAPALAELHQLAGDLSKLQRYAARRLSGLAEPRPLATWWPASDPRSQGQGTPP